MYDYGMTKKQTRSDLERARQLRVKQAAMRDRATPNFKELRQPTYFKQWRKYRKMTLEVAAELSGMSPGNISAMERGAQGYTQDGLEALARAYDCKPGQLLMVDPLTSDIWSIWELAKTGLPQREPDKPR